MPLLTNHLGVVPIGKLLQGCIPNGEEELACELRIPGYQRPYVWTERNIGELWQDVLVAQQSPSSATRDYPLGTVILHKVAREDGGRDILEVVDGQQRLLTISMIIARLRKDPSMQVEGDGPAGRAWAEIGRLAQTLGVDGTGFHDFLRDRCSVVVVVTDTLDEAFRFFDAQNARGKALQPHDLLKAYHLRAMTHLPAAESWAAVDVWESVPDHDLSELFGTYLHRIVKWSRDEDAESFTVADLDVFKGLPSMDQESPAMIYHSTAQSFLPALARWSGKKEPEPSSRDMVRARFQLDQPILGGRDFFERVAFLLKEVKIVASLLESEVDPFVGSRERQGREIAWYEVAGRYRYLSELLVCGALFHVNKFGEGALAHAKGELVRWAFETRLRQQRVTWRMVNNRARGKGVPGASEEWNLFSQIRNSALAAEVHFPPVVIADTPVVESDRALWTKLKAGEA